jgi:hypothetical protein
MHNSSKRYVLWDTSELKIAMQSDSKSTVISEAQRRNGFKPVDGSEATYSKQIA